MIELDLHIFDVGRCGAPDYQSGKRRIRDHGGRGGHEIVGRLGLELASALRAREGGDLSVRISGAEKERSRQCWGGEQNTATQRSRDEGSERHVSLLFSEGI